MGVRVPRPRSLVLTLQYPVSLHRLAQVAPPASSSSPTCSSHPPLPRIDAGSSFGSSLLRRWSRSSNLVLQRVDMPAKLPLLIQEAIHQVRVLWSLYGKRNWKRRWWGCAPCRMHSGCSTRSWFVSPQTPDDHKYHDKEEWILPCPSERLLAIACTVGYHKLRLSMKMQKLSYVSPSSVTIVDTRANNPIRLRQRMPSPISDHPSDTEGKGSSDVSTQRYGESP